MRVWWVRSDPCGIFTANLTVALLLYAEYVMVSVIIIPSYGVGWHALCYTLCTVLALLSHTRAQLTNPGTVPDDFHPQHPRVQVDVDILRKYRTFRKTAVCKRCSTLKPSSAHHCSACSACVLRMDHHCPWVNNCVAMFNQKYFLLFLVYTCACCVYSGVLLVLRFVECSGRRRGSVRLGSACDMSGLSVGLCIGNFVEAIIFGLFVSVMFFDQMQAILDNTPGIDRMKNIKGKRKGRWRSLCDVFGETGFSWRWFFPLNLSDHVIEQYQRELGECRHAEKLVFEEAKKLARLSNRWRKAELDKLATDEASHQQQSDQPPMAGYGWDELAAEFDASGLVDNTPSSDDDFEIVDSAPAANGLHERQRS